MAELPFLSFILTFMKPYNFVSDTNLIQLLSLAFTRETVKNLTVIAYMYFISIESEKNIGQ